MKLKKVKLTKVSDDKFNDKHPNNINTGYTITGIMYNPPKMGESVRVGSLLTSTVTEVVDKSMFKTLNSTYKIEYLK